MNQDELGAIVLELIKTDLCSGDIIPDKKESYYNSGYLDGIMALWDKLKQEVSK